MPRSTFSCSRRHTGRGITLAALALGSGLATGAVAQTSGEWLMYNGGYEGTRYANLKQINRENVAQLTEAFTCPLNETTGFQSSPVVAGGKLFITTGTSTFAFDATDGRPLWKKTYDVQPNQLSQNIGVPHRGLAYADKTVFRTTNNGHVLAYNAETGDLVWDQIVSDSGKANT